MASPKDISVKTARLFIDSLRESGIDVSEAYLFGSVPPAILFENQARGYAYSILKFQRVGSLPSISIYEEIGCCPPIP